MNQRESKTLPSARINIRLIIGLVSILILSCLPVAQTPTQQIPQVETEYVGRVLNSISQQPIIGAKVSLDLQGVPSIAYTDSEGIYRFRLSITSDVSGQIRVDAQGYPSYSRNINISSNKKDIEDIRLTLQGETPPAPASQVPGSIKADMILIAAGEFTLGSNYGSSEEQPVHKVYLENYYIDKYEVSNARYKACVDAGMCQPPQSIGTESHSQYFDAPQYANYPVVYMNWYMAKVYCEWQGGRLPTEAEWEKAARGNSNNLFPWGSDFDVGRANFCDKNCIAPWPGDQNYDDGYAENAPVDSFPNGASSYGLYHMAGNVWEWVNSLDYPYPYNAGDGRENVNTVGNRVRRGGSWDNDSYNVRVSMRYGENPSTAFSNFGFRCARSQ
jgi:formylglycine-generating enzyme required for sulfatase activity